MTSDVRLSFHFIKATQTSSGLVTSAGDECQSFARQI